MKTSQLFRLTKPGSMVWLAAILCCFLLPSFSALADSHTTGVTEPVVVEAKPQAATNVTQPVEQGIVKPATEEEPEADSAIENSMANLDAIQQTLEAMGQELESSKEKSSLTHSSMQAFRDGLSSIEEKLKEAYTGLDESRGSIGVNGENIEKVHEELLESTREIRANTADLDIQKSLIEDNSIRLYEMLIRISNMREQTEELSKALLSSQDSEENPDVKPLVAADLDQIWRFITIVLAFFAPAAFLLSNALRDNGVADAPQYGENAFIVCMGAFLGYFFIGFGLMYGTTSGGFLGIDSHLFPSSTATHPDVAVNSTDEVSEAASITGFLLYQSSFIMLTAMIVSSAVGKNLSGIGVIFLAFVVGAVIIPVFGHWGWASYLTATNKGWLESAGFIDQSGSVVIHTVAAWFAFTLALRLDKSSTPPPQSEQPASELLYAAPAIFMLWISWMGFTLGNLSPTSHEIPKIVLNLSLAAATAAVISYIHYAFFHNDKGRATQMLYGGFVSGLVAIAACVQIVTPLEAITIGAVAGLVQNMTFGLLRRLFLRQTWQIITAQLIAVHGFAGIWGVLCVALFGTENTFGAPNLIQLFTQAQGIAAAIGYSIVMAHITLFLLAFLHKKQQKQTA